jgi:plasmid maintenance system antidote protein VapI
METLLKSEFAARLHVSKARVSQMIQMGLPLTTDGKVEVSAALNWIETHIDTSHKDSAARRQTNAPDTPAHAPPISDLPAEVLNY